MPEITTAPAAEESPVSIPQPITLIHPDRALLTEAAGQRLVLLLSELTAAQTRVHLSLTGGSLGIAIWKAVAASPLRVLVDWARIHCWWSDERFLSAEDAERNDHQAFEAFFEQGPVPRANLHTIGNTEQFADQHRAAAAYEKQLREAGSEDSWPIFDLSLLGMGQDGHLASLFPGKDEIHDPRLGVIGVEDSPKPPSARVSMTLPLIRRSRRIWFLVDGADKAEAAARLLDAAQQISLPESQELARTPAAGARGLEQTLYLITREALGS